MYNSAVEFKFRVTKYSELVRWCPILTIYQMNINIIFKWNKKQKRKKYGVTVRDSDQIGQLSKLCLIDVSFFFFFLCFIILGACQLLWGEKLCSHEFSRGGEKKAVKRLLSSTNVSCEPNGTGVKSQLKPVGNNLLLAASGKEVLQRLRSFVQRTNGRKGL